MTSATENLNWSSRWSLVKTDSPDAPGKKLYLSQLTRTEKKRLIKQLKSEGVEQNIIGYCSRCDLKRPYVKKDPTNIHYNCLNSCCKMLHQWDLCKYCFQEKHELKIVPDKNTRHADTVTFQRVFSKLPGDIQKYIGEYVPLIFNYVEAISRLIFCNRKLATIEKYVKQPKLKWKPVGKLIKNYTYGCKENKVYANSSRQQICNGVKEIYKRVYNQFHKTTIEEKDFWTHKEYYFQPRNSVSEVIKTLMEINEIL